MVTISGMNFTGATAVEFGTTPSSEVNVMNDTTIVATSPAGTGVVDVTVTTVGGTSATSRQDLFGYWPTISSISPSAGPLDVSTLVTITGTGFNAGSTVTLGGQPATDVTVVSPTTITALTPEMTSPITVSVSVTTQYGTSSIPSTNQYTYLAAPTVTGLSPAVGPLGGGTLVTITGSAFTGATVVEFGNNPATDVTVLSDTTITAESPAGTGSQPVSVITPGTPPNQSGAPSSTSPPEFRYEPAPSVSGLSVGNSMPNGGPTSGGTMVTISGMNFTGATVVDFGTTPSSEVNVTNDTTIVATSPAGTGVVDVTVTTVGGTSATSSEDLFGYWPTISSISPSAGPLDVSTLVTITGTGFTAGSTVTLGGQPATDVTVVSPTTITALTPEMTSPIAVSVSVTTQYGTSSIPSTNQYTYLAAPTVTGLSPAVGPLGGGTLVTITGSAFTGATVVEFGNNPATDVRILSDTTITAESPAGTGSQPVSVITPGSPPDQSGTSSSTPPPEFGYEPAPSLTTSINPSSGPAAGDIWVTISGSGFTDVSAVDFGTNPATTFKVVSTRSLMALSPAGTGTVDVTVTAAGGTSATSPYDVFTYAPTVSAISPSAGPLGGNTLVTITGTGFTGVTGVEFGTVMATNFAIVSPTTITVSSPQGTGAVGMTVAGEGGTSAASPADLFTYVPKPTVMGLSPSQGSLGGATFVTITGTSFNGATAVYFGSSPATDLTVVSDTEITVQSPPGTGSPEVSVMTPGGTSQQLAAYEFCYVAAPTVTGATVSGSTATGPTTGGTSVTITGTGFNAVTAVNFGTNQAATWTVSSSGTSLTTLSPAGAPGAVDITVTGAGGISATSTSDLFTYTTPPIVAPTVKSISPITGPVTGGTMVTIVGTNLDNPTAIFFGNVPVTTVVSESASEIVLITPTVASSEFVNVTMTTAGGTSASSPANLFFYSPSGAPLPTVSGISPRFGLPTGGTWVTITGTGFDPSVPTAVYFGKALATNVSVVSATTITAESPTEAAAGNSIATVAVIDPGGQSAPSAADLFRYTADGPQVARVQVIAPSNQAASVVVYFNQPLAPSSAQSVANYSVVGPGGQRVRVKSAAYNPVRRTVTLVLGQPLSRRVKDRLTINGETSTALTNPLGVPLDGGYTGQSGSNYASWLTAGEFVAPSSQRLVPALVKRGTSSVTVRLQKDS